jgi:hypothetical protein
LADLFRVARERAAHPRCRRPYLPKEVGHSIPEPLNGHAAPQSNDVEVDTQGLIYVIDRLQGFDILEFDDAR